MYEGRDYIGLKIKNNIFLVYNNQVNHVYVVKIENNTISSIPLRCCRHLAPMIYEGKEAFLNYGLRFSMKSEEKIKKNPSKYLRAFRAKLCPELEHEY